MDALELEAQALDLFRRSLEQPESDRVAWLSTACSDDVDLLRRVNELYAADQTHPALRTAGGFTSAFRDSTVHINGYRIMGLIGAGGMGDVYEAARDDGHFEQRVAIKVVRRAFDNQLLIDQFSKERQILADLHHPNIVTLLDGGSTEEGLPFVVTELIQGERLDHYVGQNQLSISEKLHLFDLICAAVEHAHAALIVHRDIKSGNILVQPDGSPKLLDFGVAKLLSDHDAQQTIAGALTPSFASPEQIRGERVTTATDIYSLGAVLYNILTHTPVHDAKQMSLLELEKRITVGQIEAPSQRVQNTFQNRTITKDLDAITLKAMALEPDRRYASVSLLRADIANYLQKKPVSARLDSTGYRVRKFISRHRTGMAATTVTALLLVSALVISIQQTQNANRQLAKANAIGDFMGDILMSPASRWDVDLSAGPDAKISDVLTVAGDHIVTSFAQYPDIQVELLSRVAIALERLSKKDLSVALSQQAMDIAKDIEDPELRLQAIISHGKNLTRRARSEVGLNALLEAKQILELQDRTHTPTYIYLLNDLGNAYGTFERFEEQKQTITRALEIGNRIIPNQYHPAFAGGYNHLAGVNMQLGDTNSARAATEKALAVAERNPDDVTFAYVHMYATALEILDRRFAAADHHGEIAVRELKRLLGDETREYSTALARWAIVKTLMGDLSSAQRLLTQSKMVSQRNRYRSNDQRGAEILIDVYRGEYAAAINKFDPDDLRRSDYLMNLLAMFELGVAMSMSGDETGGQLLLNEAYGKVAQRYRTSFLPHLDQRIAELDLTL